MKIVFKYNVPIFYAFREISHQRALRSGAVGSDRFIVLRAPYEEYLLQEVVPTDKKYGFQESNASLRFLFRSFYKKFLMFKTGPITLEHPDVHTRG